MDPLICAEQRRACRSAQMGKTETASRRVQFGFQRSGEARTEMLPGACFAPTPKRVKTRREALRAWVGNVEQDRRGGEKWVTMAPPLHPLSSSLQKQHEQVSS